MVNKTYFRDRRTNTIYLTTEKSFPVDGRLPLKPAYKEDTVWIDRQHLDKTNDPHLRSGGQVVGVLLVLLLWVAFWVFSSMSIADREHIHFMDALVNTGGWMLIGYTLTLHWSGLTHL